MTRPDDLIARLGLQPHPEGGHYRETWRDVRPDGGRGAGTAIYFLLRAGEESRWHRVDAVEIWHHYDGAPLELWIDDRPPRALGPDEPQIIVPAHAWQRARSTGAYSLVGCTVSPAFEFAGFELAPPGWSPGGEVAAAAGALRDARARLTQAEAEHDAASGHEKAETYAPVGYWRDAVAAAYAAWRRLAGPDAPEPG